MIFLFSWVLFRFHVRFQGCTSPNMDFDLLVRWLGKKTYSPPYGRFFFKDFPWYKVKTTPDLKQIQVESDQDDLKTWDEFENMG